MFSTRFVLCVPFSLRAEINKKKKLESSQNRNVVDKNLLQF